MEKTALTPLLAQMELGSTRDLTREVLKCSEELKYSDHLSVQIFLNSTKARETASEVESMCKPFAVGHYISDLRKKGSTSLWWD